MGRRPWVRRSVGSVRLTAWMLTATAATGPGCWRRSAPYRPAWNKPDRRWEIARPHLRVLVTELAERFGEVDVYLEFSATERCDTRCRDAQGMIASVPAWARTTAAPPTGSTGFPSEKRRSSRPAASSGTYASAALCKARAHAA